MTAVIACPSGPGEPTYRCPFVVEKQHNRRVALLRCEIARRLPVDAFPDWVEARVTDAEGRMWVFHDKSAVFSDDLAGDDNLPAEGTIACTVIAIDDAADMTVAIDTSAPDGVEAIDGTTRFTVLAEQLIDGWEPAGDDDARSVCPTCGGTGVDPGALRKKRNSPRIARAHFDDPPCPDCLGTGDLDHR
jgi:hypothetical protein